MKFFDSYFVFSKSEKKGIYLFLIILFVLCAVYWLMPKFLQPDETDFSEMITKIEEAGKKQNKPNNHLFVFNPNTLSTDSLQLLGFSRKQAFNTVSYRTKVKNFENKKELLKVYAMTDSLYERIESFISLPTTKKEVSASFKNKKDKTQLFTFDPNTISKDSLKLLGFSSKSANVFINFRNKTGGFKSKEELKKVFGVSDKLYQKLEEFIEIKSEIKEIEQQQELSLSLDLNRATATELEQAKGIGATFSKRIVTYRNKLGGFISVNQLQEVYGIDQEWIEEYGKQFELNEKELVTININTVEFKELLKHPYIEFSEVKRIINYRDMHGDFQSLEELRDNNLINPEHYRKIAPYLSLK